ncbi:hypothetical protein DLJ53_03270 [Acuticoccus sediminis]|uniref:Uncharacterized protein n=1 Tax=Acuticoccus sediminis TaxID=2184697 RepID=A0A8B2NTK0_9HYPH|nr:calcium-binding protein [Acuticoccus sediminis]RAI03527.1 hypothetical protein DLJ53_03270 [Acuticoccus sediminis]
MSDILPAAPTLVPADSFSLFTTYMGSADGQLSIPGEGSPHAAPDHALVDGSLVAPGKTVTLASGARLTVNTDLTFHYDSSDAFEHLAPGTAGTDAFTYSLVSNGLFKYEFATLGLGNYGVEPAGEDTGNGLVDLYAPGASSFISRTIRAQTPGDPSQEDTEALYGDRYQSSLPILAETEVGDVNGDGIDDMAVVRKDRLIAIFGRGDVGGIVDLDDIDETEGFVVEVDRRPDEFGYGVSAGGDVNGDGYADLALTVRTDIDLSDDEPEYTFANFLIYGQADAVSSPIRISEFTASADSAGTEIGRGEAISALGDVNGDGFDDIAGYLAYSTFYGGFVYFIYTMLFGAADMAANGPSVRAGYNHESSDTGPFGDLFRASYRARQSYVITDEATVSITLWRDDGDGMNLTATAGEPLSGGAGGDMLRGTASDDTLKGLAGRDSLVGEDGDDTLDGGADADTMIGGAGNDYYIVGLAGDRVVERIDEGHDTVLSYANNYVLDDNVEVLRLGYGRTTATGNDGDNLIVGNDGANVLIGAGGDDRIDGRGGDDRINGGVGDDTMLGGLGDDIFYVSSLDDMVIEEADGGIDTIIAYTRIELPAYVENLIVRGGGQGVGNGLGNAMTLDDGTGTLSGAAGDDTLTGNAGNDELFGDTGDDLLLGGDGYDLLDGGSGADTLDGGAGWDTMIGGSGDDLYIVGARDDLVLEDADGGRDTVRSFLPAYYLDDNVENLEVGSLALDGGGNDLANVITGNDRDNFLSGRAGDDTIVGGAGQDSIRLGAGRDVVVFGEGDSGITADTRDIVGDFVRGEDLLDLSSIDADPTRAGDQAFRFVGTGALTAAGDLGYRIYGDKAVVVAVTDASAGADLTIELTGLSAMSSADFIL